MSTGDILGGRVLCAVKEAEMPDPPSGKSLPEQLHAFALDLLSFRVRFAVMRRLRAN